MDLATDLIIDEIIYGSVAQKKSIELRYKILRAPLGLNFNPEELELEHTEIHIAAHISQKLIGILLLKPTNNPTQIKMRQVAVDFEYQHKGVGKAMVLFAEQWLIKKAYKNIELNARQNAIPFYLSLGYRIIGELFLEVGIPHSKMMKSL